MSSETRPDDEHDLSLWLPKIRKGPTRYVPGLGDVPVYRAEERLRRDPDPKDGAEVDIVTGFTSPQNGLTSLSAIQTSYVVAHPWFGEKVWLAALVWMIVNPDQWHRADRLWEDFCVRRLADLGTMGWTPKLLHVTHAQTPLPWGPVTIWEAERVIAPDLHQ